MTTSRHLMPFGAELQPDGGVRFSLWAPALERVALRVEHGPGSLPMQRDPEGWHRLITDDAATGSRYRFELGDGTAVPDPASRYQPEDVHGPSEVIDPLAYRWHDQDWHGRSWYSAIVYELHIGAFTAAGSCLAAIERLDHLAELGVTMLELMPVADFPGRRNWGYDGVLPFAPDSSYGRPEDLKTLIDAAHARGLGVLLDVVYNHLGPDGNYLARYAPQFFHSSHQTPWGTAINFDSDGSRTVREFFLHNALYWLEEFHLDGLRLDAVNSIVDDGPVHLLTELAERVRAATLPRSVHLVLENEHNEPRWLKRDAHGHAQLYDAQWNDDLQRALHVAATRESDGYYADYAVGSDRLGRALAQGFAFQGEFMPFRGSVRGAPCTHLPPSAFISFVQNHDQIGNRALGERIVALAEPAALRAVTAVCLLAPQIPLLFMGEEWHTTRPFLFFCDLPPALAEAVRAGRRREYGRFEAFRRAAAAGRIPDPQAAESFERCKLDWERLQDPRSADIVHWYRDLLAVRRRHIVPLLPRLAHAGSFHLIDEGAVVVRWAAADGAGLTLTANLSARPVGGFPEDAGALLWQEGRAAPAGALRPWCVRWMLRA